MSNIVSKLTALGYRPRNEGEGVLQDRLELSGEIGTLIPEDYREFLGSFPLTGRFDRQIVFSGIEKSPWASGDFEVLETLYGRCFDSRNDLLMVRRQYADQIPAYFLAIGLITGANLVCLDLRSESLGQVYVWDHEHMDDARAGFYLTAASFGAFIESLHEARSEPRKDGPKLVKKELSDTLKTRVAELLKNKK